MKKLYLIFTLFSLISTVFYSQKNLADQVRFIDNVRFGGGINIGFGSEYSTFAISPSAIYDFSDEFSAGMSLSYAYINTKSDYYSKTSFYGGSLLGLYRPNNYMQISTEFELMNAVQKYIDEEFSHLNNAIYVGLEYLSGNFAMGVRYDILYDSSKNHIYLSPFTPIVRFYF